MTTISSDSDAITPTPGVAAATTSQQLAPTSNPMPNGTQQIYAQPEQRQKKKRDSLSIGEKSKIIRLLQDTGQSRRALARHMRISRSTMHSIWKNRDDILEKSNTLPQQQLGNIKRCRPPQYPEVEERIFAFCHYVRAHHKSATKSLIIAKARRVATQLGLNTFAASNGWYAKFLRRRGLPVPNGSRLRPFEPVQLSLDEKIRTLKQNLASFDISNIYTTQDTSFLYRSLPDRTFVENVHAQPPRAQIDNPKIIFSICVNVTGSHAIPLTFVGTDRVPPCFDLADAGEEHEQRYQSQTNASVDTLLFEKWLRMWYDEVRTFSRPPWALVINRREPLDRWPQLPGVKYFELPHTDDKNLHPLSQGVATTVMVRARMNMIQTMIRSLESATDLHAIANTLRPGATGIMYGRKATLLDAMRALSASFKDLQTEDIVRGWVNAGILCPDQESCIRDLANRAPQPETLDSGEVGVILTKMKGLIEGHTNRQQFEREFGNFVVLNAEIIDRWIEHLHSNEREAQVTFHSIGDTEEEILAASETAERETPAEDAAEATEKLESSAVPNRVQTTEQRLHAAHASSAGAVKVLQNALNEVSLCSASHVVLGKLAEALRLATEDRDQKKTRLDALVGSSRVAG